MSELVFFLEEPSAKEMLKSVLPKILPDTIIPRYLVFEGKQDLEKRLPIKLKAWKSPGAKFVVMRDKDSGCCFSIKSNLVDKCRNSGKPDTLVRIACHELESFYLGDLAAVAKSIGPNNLAEKQNIAKFRDPDKLSNASQELKRIAPNYQKISGSRDISKHLDITNNRSKSFNALISGVKRLVDES
ncbi:hypothetical protein BPLS_P4406 [Bathymodiolus platifrons methanotrophic gill symbiont]|uniref:DUF4276 family protein n=1 Tax=unclassified Gammaproteobacteria TaxID=33811 RepID=UPI001B565997|nr:MULTISPECIES: DUF4276 family protein [unclassified Gammaproteobacteria]GFO73737.1 hypothetical protein BJAS_P4739 [Bathymodiolus japonicus methanotrophic gill symbiont]GFO76555.1 hypothetical protein BPLS_P4406 [Bathymodiolus platifrons methanotrophic gill symbiont]